VSVHQVYTRMYQVYPSVHNECASNVHTHSECTQTVQMTRPSVHDMIETVMFMSEGGECVGETGWSGEAPWEQHYDGLLQRASQVM